MPTLERLKLADPQNRRDTVRRSVMFPAVCCFAHGQHKRPCTIRDLSAVGALVSFPMIHSLAKSVFLINVTEKLVYDATLVWRQGTLIGLRFKRTRKISDLTTPDVAYLYRAWLNRAGPPRH